MAIKKTATKKTITPRSKSTSSTRSTAKNASVKKPTRSTTPKSTETKEVKKETPSSKVSPSRIPVKNVVVGLAVILVIIGVIMFKNQIIVATVNGQPITRFELISELEKKDGKTVLTSLVTEKLIMQEAEKKKIVVNDDEVKKEISNIEKNVSSQGQNIDLLLAQQGMTRADLQKQVKIQLTLKKMAGDTKVTQKEVDDYINQNKESIPEGTDPATLATQAKQQLEQQKINDKIQTLITDLQKKAKINYLLPL